MKNRLIVSETRSVAVADSTIDPLWENYVCRHPDAVLFHHPSWYKALEKENKQTVIRLVCTNQSGSLVGVMPLIATRGMPFGIGGVLAAPRLSSLPRTPFCGPLSDSASITILLIKKAMEIAQSKNPHFLQFKSLDPGLCPEISEIRSLAWRNTYIKIFPDRSNELYFGNPRNHRRILASVNKTNSSGATLRLATVKDDLVTWYRLYLKTMQRHMVPSRSFIFFSELWENCYSREYIKLLLVDYTNHREKKTIAGSLFLMFNRWSYYAFNGSDTDYFALRPNDFIQWHFQNDAHHRGLRSIDLGEAEEDNKGLIDFKKKWGCAIQPIYHYYFPPLCQLPKKNGPVPLYRLCKPLWRRLPTGATTIVGKLANNFL